MTLTSNHVHLHLGRYGLLAIARRHPQLFDRLLRNARAARQA